MITLVAAMSHGRAIGKDGGLPWGRTMKTDQSRYKAMVDGKIVVIGRRTYDPTDEFLNSAKHIYLFTNQPFEPADRITPATSAQQVLDGAGNQDVLVLGGASVFEQFLPHADKLELTYIDAEYEGDRFFPEFNEADWQVVHDEWHEQDENNKHNYRFVTLVKR